MKKYNKYVMTERLMKKAGTFGVICVWDFPDYDEHDVKEIEGILKEVAEKLDDYGYEATTYPAPKCGWGLSDKTLLEAKIRFPWG